MGETLAEISYDPVTGELRRSNGTLAGTRRRDGYGQVYFQGKHHLSHRVCWFLMTGGWPENEIDHVNHDRMDNRWFNLRAATRSQNEVNKARRGVYMIRPDRWRARINGKHIGYFASESEALASYKEARRAHFGEYAHA